MQAHPKSRALPAGAAPWAPQPVPQAVPKKRGTARGVEGEVYRVVAPLHLGLGLKLGQGYSKTELEKRCKGDAPRKR